MHRKLKFRVWDKINQIFFYVPLFDNYWGGEEGEKIAQQFTGLKDKNGIEIYDGDIVKYDGMSLDYSFIGVVEFCNCCFTLLEKSSEVRITLGAGLKLEIIGNIFENPELLKNDQGGQKSTLDSLCIKSYSV